MATPAEAAAADGDDEEARVLAYMRQANRPYSANDVVTNLHKAVGKAAVQRCLDALVQRGDLCEKTSGKQKVYVAKQQGLPVPSQAEARELESRAVAAEQALKAELAELKRLQQSLGQLRSRQTVEQLRQRLEEELRPQLAEKEQRLADIESGAGRRVTPGQVAEARKLRGALVAEWRKRKRACVDLVDCVLEGYPASKKAFYEEVGLETDEEHKAFVPSNV